MNGPAGTAFALKILRVTQEDDVEKIKKVQPPSPHSTNNIS